MHKMDEKYFSLAPTPILWALLGPRLSQQHEVILQTVFQVAAIAPWFCLRLPSCGPGFESQVHHLCFFQFVLKL